MEKEKEGTETEGKQEGGRGKKFSIGEIVLVTLLLSFVEFAEFASNLISPVPVVGQVALGLSWFFGLITMALVQFYLFMKGVRNLWFLAGGLMDQIPFVAALPLKIATWFVVVLMTNNKKLSKVAGAATGKPTTLKK